MGLKNILTIAGIAFSTALPLTNYAQISDSSISEIKEETIKYTVDSSEKFYKIIPEDLTLKDFFTERFYNDVQRFSPLSYFPKFKGSEDFIKCGYRNYPDREDPLNVLNIYFFHLNEESKIPSKVFYGDVGDRVRYFSGYTEEEFYSQYAKLIEGEIIQKEAFEKMGFTVETIGNKRKGFQYKIFK